MEELPPWVELLRQLLDEHDPLELLNDRMARSMMREFVSTGGQMTRPALATQAFVFGASLERERARSMLLRGTWPCHDEAGDGGAPATSEG